MGQAGKSKKLSAPKICQNGAPAALSGSFAKPYRGIWKAWRESRRLLAARKSLAGILPQILFSGEGNTTEVGGG